MNPVTNRHIGGSIAPGLLLLMTLAAGITAAQEPEGQDDDPTKKPIVLKLDYESQACVAHLSLEYFQRGDSVRVETNLTNDDCAASSGTYSLQVRYRDEDNQLHNIDYDETWSRTDDQPVIMTRDYLMAPDVDLVRVRSRKLKCECTEPKADP